MLGDHVRVLKLLTPVSQIAALFHISGLTALERACWSTAFFSIWRRYVEALPPSWFAREAEPVLAELGETVVLSRRISVFPSPVLFAASQASRRKNDCQRYTQRGREWRSEG